MFRVNGCLRHGHQQGIVRTGLRRMARMGSCALWDSPNDWREFQKLLAPPPPVVLLAQARYIPKGGGWKANRSPSKCENGESETQKVAGGGPRRRFRLSSFHFRVQTQGGKS